MNQTRSLLPAFLSSRGPDLGENRQGLLLFSILLLALGSVFPAFPEQEGSPSEFPVLAPPILQGENLALADGSRAPLLNPGALAFGRASGLVFSQGWNEEGLTGKQFFSASSSHSALSLRRAGNLWSPSFSLAASDRPAQESPRVYTGVSLHSRDFQFSRIRILSSLLCRPHPSLSAAGAADLMPQRDWSLRGSLALRPLAWLFPQQETGSILSLAGDIAYSPQNGWSAPLAGFHLRPHPALSLACQWNPQENFLTAQMALSWNHVTQQAATAVPEPASGDNLSGRAGLHWRPEAVPPPSPKPVIRKLDLPQEIIGSRPAPSGLPLFSQPSQGDLYSLLGEIEAYRKDPSTAGLLLENPVFSASLAVRMELAAELNRFRESGKKVIVYFTNPSTSTYLFAAACADRIYLAPPGTLNLTGYSISRTYLGRFLQRWGITVDNIRSGSYKSGGNAYSEGEISAQERENLKTYLDDLYQGLLERAVSNRGGHAGFPGDTAGLDRLIKEGPWIASRRALDTGLVDKLLYENQLKRAVRETFGCPLREESEPPPPALNTAWSRPAGSRVALVRIAGPIHSGKETRGTIGAQSLTQRLRRIRRNPEIQAVLLRINSGGGSALASDLIAHEIESLEDAGKPVVVLMGGAAASGGYYIAAPAGWIIASPFTLTGSIGVYGLLPDASALLEEQKIGWASVSTGENSTFMNPLAPTTNAERQRLQKSINRIYQRFTSLVADGRNFSPEELSRAAGARIWTGRQALENGLADEMGGYRTALKKLREILGTDQLILREYPQESPAGFQTLQPLTAVLLPAPPASRLLEEFQKDFAETERLLSGNTRLWARCPYQAP